MESAGPAQWEGTHSPTQCSPSLVVKMGTHFMLLFSVHLQGYQISFFLPLKIALDGSVCVHLRKPMQYPINPLNHFNNWKMIRAWLMTALVSYPELCRKPCKSFHLRDLLFCGHPNLLCPTAWQPACGPLQPPQGTGSVWGPMICLLLPPGSNSSS